MKNTIAVAGVIAALWLGNVAPAIAEDPKTVQVVLETSQGVIEIALDPVHAPLSVANFLSYAKEGFYNGTTFHRVIPGFMIQGGGFTAQMEERATHAPIRNEAENGLLNKRGSIAMARTNDPHSATAQFFINVADNAPLDFTQAEEAGWGYAVFGQVTKGMDIVDAIAGMKTTRVGPYSDVPSTPIDIKRVVVQ